MKQERLRLQDKNFPDLYMIETEKISAENTKTFSR